MSLGGPSSNTAVKSTTTAGKSIKDLEKERAQTGIWASSQKPGGVTSTGTGNTFGNFGPVKAGETSSGGGDDLLL